MNQQGFFHNMQTANSPLATTIRKHVPAPSLSRARKRKVSSRRNLPAGQGAQSDGDGTYPRHDLRTECSCGALSYSGGWCFGCGKYRSSKPARRADVQDLTDYQKHGLGHRLSEFRWPPNAWNA